MIRRFALLMIVMALSACGSAAPIADAPARRIVSLDYCADQYVLALADRTAIAAVSTDATASFSYLRNRARGIPTVRARAEDILALKPDLVVRAYGGGYGIADQLARAGIPTLQTPNANDFAEIRAAILTMATALHAPDRGAAMAAAFDARLVRLKALTHSRETAMYVTAGGATTGPGTLVHDMLALSGHENFTTEPGWRSIPLEALAYRQPDLIAFATFGAKTATQDAWSPASHPVMQTMLQAKPVAAVDGAWTSCGAWFILDAVEAIAASGR